MPIHDYACQNVQCGNMFEQLTLHLDDPLIPVKCPQCGQRDTVKRFPSKAPAGKVRGGTPKFHS